MCQGMDVDEWIDLRREDVLDAPYFHTVFSIPSQLYPLVYANQKLLYDALYHAANKTLTELSGDPTFRCKDWVYMHSSYMGIQA